MSPQLVFGLNSELVFNLNIAFCAVSWAVFAWNFIWPWARNQPRVDALRPLLTLHSFRFLGLAFLIPGVVSPNLPAAFTYPAAVGDLIAAVLALLAMAALRTPIGMPLVWLFNIWGSADLINAIYQGIAAQMQAGQLGAAYFIPTFIVPLLLVTHFVMFVLMLRRTPTDAVKTN